jgi:formylglycine-generating enzyme required for sulfatase activity
VLLPGGSFGLGAQARDPQASDYDPGASPDEGPVQRVELEPFFLSKYEMTQGQWRRFVGANPSKHLSGSVKAGRELGELSPVEQVSWLVASAQLARLGWKLPTEAQWEYAARGGTESPWWTGDEPASLEGAANLSDRFARTHQAPWKSFEDELDDGNLVHAVVGSFEANGLGLHDVLGNVFEWCRDQYGEYTLPTARGDGERLGGDVGLRVLRGGSFISSARNVRSAKRDTGPPELQNEALGLRPMRAVER